MCLGKMATPIPPPVPEMALHGVAMVRMAGMEEMAPMPALLPYKLAVLEAKDNSSYEQMVVMQETVSMVEMVQRVMLARAEVVVDAMVMFEATLVVEVETAGTVDMLACQVLEVKCWLRLEPQAWKMIAASQHRPIVVLREPPGIQALEVLEVLVAPVDIQLGLVVMEAGGEGDTATIAHGTQPTLEVQQGREVPMASG